MPMAIQREQVIGRDEYQIDFLDELSRWSCSRKTFHESE
jgi:hypothetical protein